MQFTPDHQHLPIPVGGAAPAHHRSGRAVLRWRHRVGILYAVAALLASAAAVVALEPADSAMYLDAGGIRVDGQLLTPSGGPAPGRWFRGNATFLLRTDADGTVHGFAASTLDGHAVTGQCAQRDDEETCTFNINGASFTARDTYDSRHTRWTRIYSNGQQVTIDVAAGAEVVPVALPLGWD